MPKYDFYEINSQLTLPYLSSDMDIVMRIFTLLEERFGLIKGSNQQFIDLGSGNGSVVIYSASKYKIKSTGIEINQNLVKEAESTQNKLQREIRRNIMIVKGDLFQQDLKKFDFVYIFSLPTMQNYLTHTFKTIKKGAILISYRYPLNNKEKLFELIFKSNSLSENVFFYRKV